MSANDNRIRSTTILAVRRDEVTAIGGDGQVTLGETAVKHDTNKIRRLCDGKVLCGFAGSAALCDGSTVLFTLIPLLLN